MSETKAAARVRAYLAAFEGWANGDTCASVYDKEWNRVELTASDLRALLEELDILRRLS